MRKPNTVKPVYNELSYNEAHRFHRLHRFLYEMIGYNENSLLKNAFGRTDLFLINGFNCNLTVESLRPSINNTLLSTENKYQKTTNMSTLRYSDIVQN